MINTTFLDERLPTGGKLVADDVSQDKQLKSDTRKARNISILSTFFSFSFVNKIVPSSSNIRPRQKLYLLYALYTSNKFRSIF